MSAPAKPFAAPKAPAKVFAAPVKAAAAAPVTSPASPTSPTAAAPAKAPVPVVAAAGHARAPSTVTAPAPSPSAAAAAGAHTRAPSVSTTPAATSPTGAAGGAGGVAAAVAAAAAARAAAAAAGAPAKITTAPVAAKVATPATSPVAAKTAAAAPVVAAKTAAGVPAKAGAVPAKADFKSGPPPAKNVGPPPPGKVAAKTAASSSSRIGSSARESKGETKGSDSGRSAAAARVTITMPQSGAAGRSGIDAKIMENRMQQMSDLTKDRRAARKVARNKDTIDTLLGALNNSPKFTKMVEYSVTCIKNLSVDVTSAIELVDSGVVESLLNVLNLNPFNERIQQLVNEALSALCLTDQLAELVMSKLGTKPILRSMKQHQNPETLISDCRAMKSLMKSNANVELFVKDGAIDALAGVVKGAKGNVDVITAATSCLNRICDNPANCAAVMESGQVELILKAMRENPGNAELADQGMNMIMKLARSSPDILAKLRALGAVDIIVDILDAHPDNKHLIAVGAKALEVLGNKADVSSAMAKMNIGTGNTEKKVDTGKAMTTLSSLMLVPENVEFMIKNQGIEGLIAALQAAVGDHSDSGQRILYSGCQALMRCAGDEQRIYQIMQKGGVKLLISIINAHVKEEKVACAAMAALTALVTRKENAIFIIKSGGIAAALNLLKEHPNSEKVARHVLEFFWSLAQSEEAIPLMVAAGCMEAILGILKIHGKNGDIVTLAMKTLGKLANTPENLQRLAAAGGMAALLQALMDNKDNLEVTRSIMAMIEIALGDAANQEELRKLGAQAAILGVMSSFKEDKDLQALGKRILAKLSGGAVDQLKEACDNVGLLVRMVNETGGHIHIPSLLQAVDQLANLALMDGNIEGLIKNNAVDVLLAAFMAAVALPPSAERQKLMALAALGLLRLATKNALVGQSLVKGSAAGGLSKLLKAALANTDNEELGLYVANMAWLCAANPNNVAKIFSDGCVEEIVLLAKAFPLNEKILSFCTAALGALCTTPEYLLRIIRAGGAEVVVETIFANMDNEDALLRALAVLQQFAVDETAILALVKAGAIDAILEAMRTHVNSARIQQSCMQALCRLLVSEDIAISIGVKGGVPLCVGAMRNMYNVESLCEVCLILMDSLATLPKNAELMNDPALASLDLIRYIAGCYPANQPIIESAAKLIGILSTPAVVEPSPSMTISDASIGFDAINMDNLLDRMKNNKLNGADLKKMLNNLADQLQDPANARMMVERGGLQAIAAVIKQSRDNEGVFYAAAKAFIALTDHGGDNVLINLEDPLCIDALCDLMNANEIFGNPLDAGNLAKAIGVTARMKLSPGSIKQMMKNAPLAGLLKILTTSDDPILLTQAARLLGKLSNNEEVAKVLAKIVNIRELIAAMRRQIKNQDFLKYAVFLLGNLAQNPEVSTQIGSEGGILLILQLMEMYPNNAPLIENCCYALSNLALRNEANCKLIVDNRGIPIILAAILLHNRAEELLESAVRILNNLCRGNNGNKDAIVKAGGAQAIVDTVLNNFNALDLLLACFRVFGNLAYSKENVGAIIKAGGVQGIVAGMTVHTEETDVIDIAVRVLTNMSSDIDGDHMAIMVQEGAVQAVVEVFNQYIDNLDIEIATLACLSNLARFPDNARIMITQGIANGAIKTMKALRYNPELVAPSLKLLHVLSYCQTEIVRLLESKISTGIVAAISAHKTTKSIITAGLGAITNLSYNVEAAGKIAEEGPIELCLAIATECAVDADIQAECFQCLSALSRHEKNAGVIAVPAQRAVITAFRTHIAVAKLMPIAFSFLSNLCVHKVASEQTITTGIIPAILAVLKKYNTDDRIQIRGLRSLENIAYGSTAVKDNMRKEGVETAVVSIADNNPTKDDVRRACKAVLDALNRGRKDLGSMPVATIKPVQIQKKSAKQLFGDDEKEEKITLRQEVRNFLLAGMLLTKHSKSGSKQRHLYVDAEMKTIICKDPREPIHPKNKNKLFKVRTIDPGRAVPELQKKGVLGKFSIREEFCFAITTRSKPIAIECASEAIRNKWVEYLQLLLQYYTQAKAISAMEERELADEALAQSK